MNLTLPKTKIYNFHKLPGIFDKPFGAATGSKAALNGVIEMAPECKACVSLPTIY